MQACLQQAVCTVWVTEAGMKEQRVVVRPVGSWCSLGVVKVSE